LRVAFAGTPEFAAAALEAIIAAGFTVPLVLTQPDRPAGRGMKLNPSPVKQVALAHGIAVDQPERLRTGEQRAALVACAPDVLVVAAYGLILPRAVLDLPRLGCINIHASLLPRWRGAAPIHRAIEAGDAQTGITIMQMDEGLDTGAMLLERALPINADDTTGSLHDRLAALGAEMIVDALRRLPQGGLAATPQPAEGATYAAKIGKAEAALDWRRPAEMLARAVRAFNPFPGAVATLREVPVKVWRAEVVDGYGEPGTVLAADDDGVVVACGERALRLVELQKPGSRRLPAGEFLRGFPVCAGERFGFAAA
jgi:methionyl-tRNA formyltransferase